MDKYRKPFKDGIAPKNLYKEKSLEDYIKTNENIMNHMWLELRKAIDKREEEFLKESSK